MEGIEYDEYPDDPYDQEDDKVECRKEFAYKEVIARKSMLNLTDNYPDEIAHDRSNEKSLEGYIGIIYEGPGSWIECEKS